MLEVQVMGGQALKKQGSIFFRKQLFLPRPDEVEISDRSPAPQETRGGIGEYLDEKKENLSDLPVLVINSSQDMAKEITLQLTLAMPGCSIMYAPTLNLAAWILSRRDIQLVVSSPVLPDGSIARLTPVLAELDNHPDLVVVGSMSMRNAKEFGRSGYEFAAMKHLQSAKPVDTRQQMLSAGSPDSPDEEAQHAKRLKALGADIRNDLNNPLQEIVAMVFVAQAEGHVAPGTEQALRAIDLAAQNMAAFVEEIEDRILKAVGE